jgi:hypothetical protein
MFSADQGHLRKYLTTLGVTIAAGTLSLAGLFLRLAQDLIVTRSTLAKLTPIARAALLQRQRYLAVGTTVLPFFVVIGFFGGLGLATYGLVGWARRQRIADEREDIGLRKDRVELLQLTDVEKADKLDREAKNAVEVSSLSPAASPRRLSDVRSELALIENQLVSKLSALSASYRVSGASIARTSSGQRVDIDAVLSSPLETIVFELKYAASAKNVLNQIADGLQRLARAAEVTKAKRGVLILIAPDDASSEQIANWRHRAKEMASDYRAQLNVYVDRYSEFLNLSGTDFAAHIGLGHLTAP